MKRHGSIEPSADLKDAAAPLSEGEPAYPDADRLPTDETQTRYTGGNADAGLDAFD